MMNLLWPGFLLLLSLIPLLIAAYLWVLRRRRRYAVRFSSLALIRDAIPQYSRWRRYLPPVLFLIAVSSLIVALARPMSVVAVPTNQTTIVLTMDVSGSMCSTDIQPTRLEAAQAAANTFIENEESGTQIGIVAFSGFAELVRPPTTEKLQLQAAIQSLLTGRGTAMGSGILKAIDTIAELDPTVARSVPNPNAPDDAVAVPPGVYAPAIIVVLTDGVTTTGYLPLEAAQQAAKRGIRVYTIGFGTAQGSEFRGGCFRYQGREPFSGGGGGMGFGGGGGQGGFRRGIDEATLIQIAEMTGGEYYSAESAGELQDVFNSLPTNLILKTEATEISFAFTAIGALLAALALMLSMRWHPLM